MIAVVPIVTWALAAPILEPDLDIFMKCEVILGDEEFYLEGATFSDCPIVVVKPSHDSFCCNAKAPPNAYVLTRCRNSDTWDSTTCPVLAASRTHSWCCDWYEY